MIKKKKRAVAKKDTKKEKQQNDAGQSAAAKSDTGKPRVKKSKQLNKEESVNLWIWPLKKYLRKLTIRCTTGK